MEQTNHNPSPYEAGQKLRRIREAQHLKFRDVEQASQQIATRHNDRQFHIGLSRLADIECKGTVPSVFRLYSLAAIYRVDFRSLLGWYGIDLDALARDAGAIPLQQTSVMMMSAAENVPLPNLSILADGPEPTRSFYFGRHVRSWGVIPATLLGNLELEHKRYAFVGTDETFLHPVLRAGSFVQIDETRNRVVNSGWEGEWDRPIYLVETRDGYRFGWCSLRGSDLVLQPHPSSFRAAEILRYPAEAEIVGQVVAIAMRLDPEKRRRKHSSGDRG
ncbi:MAG TPA: helix-turn-helix transcriptional regulator [Bryobacteraceae bacterium]|nr:helix-turn-helix transcriptional regulator [Bryobacteraceae bacterium]